MRATHARITLGCRRGHTETRLDCSPTGTRFRPSNQDAPRGHARSRCKMSTRVACGCRLTSSRLAHAASPPLAMVGPRPIKSITTRTMPTARCDLHSRDLLSRPLSRLPSHPLSPSLAFCQARLSGTLAKPPPSPAVLPPPALDSPPPSPFSPREMPSPGSSTPEIGASRHSYSYLNKQAQRESISSLPADVIADFELLHEFELSGADHTAEAQCALIQKLFPRLSAKQARSPPGSVTTAQRNDRAA